MDYENDINTSVEKLENLLQDYKPELEPIAKNIISICDKVEESWSGSWIGYHANLYFAGYQAPPRNKMFNIEWGGLHGYDPGWQSKSLNDMWTYVQEESSVKFDLDDSNDKLDELREATSDLKTLFELNSKDEALTKKIEDINTEFTMSDYITARRPGSIISRDSQAIYQGIKLPPHIQCLAFAYTIRQNISAAESLLKLSPLVSSPKVIPSVITLKDDELQHLNPKLLEKVGKLYVDGHYSEAVGKAFTVVKDRLRDITGKENGFPAFDEAGLYIKGSAADNVDDDFQEGVRRLLGSIDKFRNEKFHTSEGNLKDKDKALSYLYMCSLALSFLSDSHYSIKDKLKNKKQPSQKTQ